MLYLIGFFYVLAYFAFCWKRPQLAMMLVFALAPFQNDIGAMLHPRRRTRMIRRRISPKAGEGTDRISRWRRST